MSEQIQKIPLDLLDNPRLAMRTKTDDAELDELMRDMREIGLIQPITVRPVCEVCKEMRSYGLGTSNCGAALHNARYEIIAGHRRSRSARLLGWATIDAKVIEASDEQAFAMRLIENSSRKDVDPVDEACFIGEIMQKYGKSADDISKIMHRSVSWVNDRLEIFSMPLYLQEILRTKKIPLGSALWLNKIPDEKVKEDFSRMAALQGLSVPRARYWVESWLAGKAPQNPAAIPEIPPGGIRQPIPLLDFCIICGVKDNVDNFSMYCGHPACVNKFFEIREVEMKDGGAV